MLIDDEASLTPHRLRAKVRKNTRLYSKPKAIFIDYIQLMRTGNKTENRNLELAEISNDLKKLAKETGCPIYALSQLNRGLENRANKRQSMPTYVTPALLNKMLMSSFIFIEMKSITLTQKIKALRKSSLVNSVMAR